MTEAHWFSRSFQCSAFHAGFVWHPLSMWRIRVKCDRIIDGLKDDGASSPSWNTMVTMSFPMCLFLSTFQAHKGKRQKPKQRTLMNLGKVLPLLHLWAKVLMPTKLFDILSRFIPDLQWILVDFFEIGQCNPIFLKDNWSQLFKNTYFWHMWHTVNHTTT